MCVCGGGGGGGRRRGGGEVFKALLQLANFTITESNTDGSVTVVVSN